MVVDDVDVTVTVANGVVGVEVLASSLVTCSSPRCVGTAVAVDTVVVESAALKSMPTATVAVHTVSSTNAPTTRAMAAVMEHVMI